MSREQFVGLLLRIVGIYIVVAHGLAAIWVLLAAITGSDIESALVILLVVIEVAVGLYLAIFPLHCVRLLTPVSEKVESVEDPLVYADFQTLAFVCLGLFFLVPNIIPFIRSVSEFASQPDMLGLLYYFDNTFFSVGAGVWLILGGKGLMNIVRRLRTVGQNS